MRGSWSVSNKEQSKVSPDTFTHDGNRLQIQAENTRTTFTKLANSYKNKYLNLEGELG